MASATLGLAGLTSLVTGGAFLVVARALGRRDVSRENRLGRAASLAWWGALGAYLLLQGSLTLAAAAGRLDEGGYLLSRLVAIPLLCAATWGLTCHLAFLHTGSRRLGAALGALYAAVAVLFAYATFGGPDKRLDVGAWVVRYGDGEPIFMALYALVGVPPILASLAYLALLPRAREPLQRYRIALTAGALLAYVGGGLAARLAGSDLVVFLTLVPLGLLAAAASVLAHHPPKGILRRLAPEG